MAKTLPSYARGAGLIPGQEGNIPHPSWPKNQYCDKFNKEFYNGPHQKKNLKNKWAKDLKLKSRWWLLENRPDGVRS